MTGIPAPQEPERGGKGVVGGSGSFSGPSLEPLCEGVHSSYLFASPLYGKSLTLLQKSYTLTHMSSCMPGPPVSLV